MPEINVLSGRLASAGKVFCPVQITGAAIRMICSLYRDDFSRFGYVLPRHAIMLTARPVSSEGAASIGPARTHVPAYPGTPIDEADVHIIVDHRRINPLRTSRDAWQFVVPAKSGSMQLCSRTKSSGQTDDHRVLGLCVRALEVQGSDGKFHIALDHPMLARGFYEVERDDRRIWRWTDGNALIPVALLGYTSKPTILTIRGVPSSALASADG
jgi:hypothetical protein